MDGVERNCLSRGIVAHMLSVLSDRLGAIKNSPQSEWDRADWAPSDGFYLGSSAGQRLRTMTNRSRVGRILLYSRHSTLDLLPGKSASLVYPARAHSSRNRLPRPGCSVAVELADTPRRNQRRGGPENSARRLVDAARLGFRRVAIRLDRRYQIASIPWESASRPATTLPQTLRQYGESCRRGKTPHQWLACH